MLFKLFPQSSFTLSSKTIGHTLKTNQNYKYVWVHKIIQLIIMKMKMKIKSRSHRYDTNRPRSWHGYEYSKHKKCLRMMMLIYIGIKQYLSNIWSSIHEKVKQHWGWVEEKRCLWRKRVINVVVSLRRLIRLYSFTEAKVTSLRKFHYSESAGVK